MKKLKYFCLAFLVAFILVIPAAAQKGEKGERNNNNPATKTHGKVRADQVQDTNNVPTKGSKGKKGKKTRTREGWEKNTNHRGSSK